MSKFLMFCLAIVTVAISLALLFIVGIITCSIKKGICNKSWCKIQTDISIKKDGNSSYKKDLATVCNKEAYLKYEITVKPTGFLARFRKFEVPIEITTNLPHTQVHPLDHTGSHKKITVNETETKFNFEIVCDGNKKSNKLTIIFKCKPEPQSKNEFIEFKLSFSDKHLDTKYSRMVRLEFKEKSNW